MAFQLTRTVRLLVRRGWTAGLVVAVAAALSAKAFGAGAPGTELSATQPGTTSGRTALAVSTNNAATLDDTYKLAIGDLLSFKIEEDQDDPPKQLVVTDSGDLDIPYIGRMRAQAKTCRQVAREIKAALEKEYYYQATVIIAVDQRTKSRGKVYIVGPVHTPGPQEIPSDETLTLTKAILRAGGFTEIADRHNVRVTRTAPAGPNEKKVLTVDVGQIFDKGKVELDPVLEPGDLIVVPERLVRF